MLLWLTEVHYRSYPEAWTCTPIIPSTITEEPVISGAQHSFSFTMDLKDPTPCNTRRKGCNSPSGSLRGDLSYSMTIYI